MTLSNASVMLTDEGSDVTGVNPPTRCVAQSNADRRALPRRSGWSAGPIWVGFQNLRTEIRRFGIPYFIPSTGATVGDGQTRSATETPGGGPVRDGQVRSETALKRLLIRRFWVRNPGGAPRSTRLVALSGIDRKSID